MPPINARALAALAAATLALRLGVAALTESHPLFPAYYYTDAQLIDDAALRIHDARRQGGAHAYVSSLSQMLQAHFQASLYRLTGPRPFAAKLLNALAGTAAVLLLFLALRSAFDERAALAAAALVAAWPSHVFYTSQNLKEAPVGLLVYAALACMLPLFREDARRVPALAAAVVPVLLATGFYRSYVLLALAAALSGGFVLELLRVRAFFRPAAGLLACAAACLLYRPLAQNLVQALYPPHAAATDGRVLPGLLPDTMDEFQAGVVNRPTSPEGITAFRRSRQFADRRWALQKRQRAIGTQLFPDAEFRSWLDVLAYVPKGAFYVLFMPLPGLYALEGKLGRLLASGENLLLLVLFALAAAGTWHGPKTPARAALLLFFAAMTVGAALLEFDLGSASRHKLLYLPLLFPFAAEEALRLRRGRRP